MKTITSILIFGLMVFSIEKNAAQNLVPNGSFEEYYSCPQGLNRVDSCMGWYHYGGIPYLEGTPDYFDSCTTAYQNHVPDNLFGSQVSFQGSAYMGLYAFVTSSSWYLEYIGAKLIDTLVPGNNYTVSMRVSRGDLRPMYAVDACVASNNMGIRLTTFPYSQNGGSIPTDNFAQLHEDSIITDTINWILLSWKFIPDSAYSYLYIGNFFTSNSTDTLRIGCGNAPGSAYYYIDSVNIYCISDNCTTDIPSINASSGTSIFPNPFTSSTTITLTNYNLPLNVKLFDELGRDVTSRCEIPTFQKGSNSIITLNRGSLPKGIYFISILSPQGQQLATLVAE